MDELDPRWEWIEITKFGDATPRYMKGHCNHLEVVPVYAQNDLDRLLGEDPGTPVARLCRTCDAQLPAGWRP
jgi:hypothetical protein